MKQLALYFALFVPFGLWGKPQLEEIIGVSRGLHSPFGVTFDNQGNSYIAEYLGGRILKLDTAGKLHTLSGNKQKGYAGDGMQAKQGVFNCMHNVVWASNQVLYISDTHNNLIRKIDLKTNRLSTIAGIPNQKGFSEMVDQQKMPNSILQYQSV